MEKKIEIWGKSDCKMCQGTGVKAPKKVYENWKAICRKAINDAASGGLSRMKIAYESFQTKLLQWIQDYPSCSWCDGNGIVMKLIGYKTLGEVANPDFWNENPE